MGKIAASGEQGAESRESEHAPRSPLPAPSGTAKVDEERAERMFTSGLVKDFGAVPFGTRLLHRFAITNIYAEPVQITGLRVSCGCVTATPGKRLLEPGDSTTIDVAFDTREFTGPNTQTVKVAIGPNPQSRCKLTVSAVSQTDVVFKPDRVNFGTVARGQTPVESIDVEYHGALDWRIEEAIVAKELPFEVTWSELVRRPGKVGYRLTVALKDNDGRLAGCGRIRDYVYLKTNQKDVPPVPVLVMASVQSPGQPSPPASRTR